MSGATSKLDLYLMGGGLSGTYGADEQVNIDKVNESFTKIDAAIGLTICTSTTRPATPFDGQQIYETNTKNTLYWSVASTPDRWVPIGVPNAATAALRDALFPSPVAGERVFRTDKNWVEQYFTASAAWHPISGELPFFKYAKTATAASIPNATQTGFADVFMTTESNKDFSDGTNAFTVLVAGKYRLKAQALITAGGSVGQLILRMNANSTNATTNPRGQAHGLTSSTWSQSIMAEYVGDFAVGDIFRAFIYQESGGALAFQTAADSLSGTYFMAEYLGPRDSA